MSDNKSKTTSSHITNFLKNIINSDLEKGTNDPRHWCGHPGTYTEQMEGPIDEAKIRTRFPPEPNGYLHIGHAKSICLNFGLAREYHGRCHMRFDDTNPAKEEQEYVDTILDSVRWLGFDWEDKKECNFYFASDYFEYMYQVAEFLITTGHAYVDEQTAEEIHANRGTLNAPGKNSPYRDRPIEENLRLFREMRAGKHKEGSMVLRSKIDMASRNVDMRDPAIFRIRFAEHHRTGDKWCIYPMYAFAHPLEDILENITHSICTLEFENQRPFYNWVVEHSIPVTRAPLLDKAIAYLEELKARDFEKQARFVQSAVKHKWKLAQTTEETKLLGILNKLKETPETLDFKVTKEVLDIITATPNVFTTLLSDILSETVKPNYFLLPHQYEFNRLNLTYVVMSKRKLITLVKEKLVDGWDDPRMPTLVGIRRRGYSPEAMRLFCERVGVSKQTGAWIDYSVLENCLREVLDANAQRRIAVQKPLKLVIDNYPDSEMEEVETPNHPQHSELGTRKLSFGKELWIEENDFSENPPKGYRRLTLANGETPAQKVRLRHAYVIEATSVEKDENGKITTIHAKYYPQTKSGTDGANDIKTKAAIHWLSVADSIPAEIRLYDRLFNVEQPDSGDKDFRKYLTPNSKQVLHSYVEPSLKEAKPEDRFQFERNGYYVADQKDFSPEHLVFNLAVPLKDSSGKK